MPRRKEHHTTQNEATYMMDDILHTPFDDALSFITIQQDSELVCEPEYIIQYFIRKNGHIVDRGALCGHNAVRISSGYEVAFIPKTRGHIRTIAKQQKKRSFVS